jgi:LysR family transcriptional regulator, glycine cleavage system transcriptional activator
VSTAAYARLPLNALRVFEAVAARLSFADAAESLHVTPAAVSQQIKSLEDYLQVKLFKRSGRRVELTAEGQQLLPGVRRGLDELEAAMQHLKQNRSGGPLQISLLSSFLQRWLLPRIGAFNDLDTGIELRFHTSRDPVDFSRTEFNAAIRMGGGNYPGLYSEKIMDEWVIPIASPKLIARHGILPRCESLEGFPLLESMDEPWKAWIEKGQEGNWLARAPIIDDSAGVIAAAEEGVGYALARWSLVQRSLEQGRVQVAGDGLIPFRWSYYFVCPEPYLAMPKVKKFRDWLMDTAKAFPRPHGLFEKDGAKHGRTVPFRTAPKKVTA